jgi:hypothetical protein
MTHIFHRQYAPALWNPDALEGPRRGMTLREWEVSVILCSLPRALKKALVPRLLAPTGPRWPAPPAAGEPEPANSSPRDCFWKEIKAIRQTLDTPFAALHGIARDMRLVAHGTRLRQAAAALGAARALQEIEAAQRPADQPPPQPEPYFVTRWGGRWQAYFASGSRL